MYFQTILVLEGLFECFCKDTTIIFFRYSFSGFQVFKLQIIHPSYLKKKKKKATNVIETSNIMPTSGCVTGLGVGVKRGVKHCFY